MKATLLCFALAIPFALATPVVGQVSVDATLAAACGSRATQFSVGTDSKPHGAIQVTTGKALVYFIEDNGPGGNHQQAITRIGIDGRWVGAFQHNSYFSISVEPGEHHICASASKSIALAHFVAEPGRIYYFRTQYLAGLATMYPTFPYLQLDQPDTDEAAYLIASYPLSVSRPVP